MFDVINHGKKSMLDDGVCSGEVISEAAWLCGTTSALKFSLSQQSVWVSFGHPDPQKSPHR